MGGDPGYYIRAPRAPISHLWASYPIHVQLDDIASHLVAKGRLSKGTWTGISTTAASLAEPVQTPVLKHFCLILNDIQSFVLQVGGRQRDTEMVCAATSEASLYLQSTFAFPEAMLAVRLELRKERDCTDVICPFESTHHPRSAERVSALPILANRH